MTSLAYEPSIRDVSAVLRARTKDKYGNEGEFNADTRPTGEQVALLIGMATSHITTRYGKDLPDEYWDSANYVITLLAAKLVEISYYPEQINAERSPYIQINALYQEMLAQLDAGLEDVIAVPGAGAGLPFWFFQKPYLVGWESCW
jgi:hypothetical protein